MCLRDHRKGVAFGAYTSRVTCLRKFHVQSLRGFDSEKESLDFITNLHKTKRCAVGLELPKSKGYKKK